MFCIKIIVNRTIISMYYIIGGRVFSEGANNNFRAEVSKLNL